MSNNKDDMELLPLDFPEDLDKEDAVGEKVDDSEAKGLQAETSEAPSETSEEPLDPPKKDQGGEGGKQDPEEPSSSDHEVIPPAKKAKSKVMPIQGTFLPGQILQEGRVRADLSIEQVAQETKINKKYIISLEMGDSENLPPGIYVGAYIKQLCKLYKLDPEQVLNAMDIESGIFVSKKVPGEILQDIEKGKQINFQEEVRVRKFLKLVAAAILLIILIVFVVIKMSSRKVTPSDQAGLVQEEGNASGETVAQRPEKSIAPEELEIFLAPQSFTMTELKVPK